MDFPSILQIKLNYNYLLINFINTNLYHISSSLSISTTTIHPYIKILDSWSLVIIRTRSWDDLVHVGICLEAFGGSVLVLYHQSTSILVLEGFCCLPFWLLFISYNSFRYDNHDTWKTKKIRIDLYIHIQIGHKFIWW